MNNNSATSAIHTTQVQSEFPALISASKLADLLGISTRTLWRLRSSGKLPRPVRLGGSVRWKVEEVQAWIDDGCPTIVD